MDLLFNVAVLLCLGLGAATQCYELKYNYGQQSLALDPVTHDTEGVIISDAIAFYDYSDSAGHTGYEQEGTINIMLVEDSTGNVDFIIEETDYLPYVDSSVDLGFAHARYMIDFKSCTGLECDTPMPNSGIELRLIDSSGDNIYDDSQTSSGCTTADTDVERCSVVQASTLADGVQWQSCSGGTYGHLHHRFNQNDGIIVGFLPDQALCMSLTLMKYELNPSNPESFPGQFMIAVGTDSTVNLTREEMGTYLQLCGRACATYCDVYTTCSECAASSRCGWQYDDASVTSTGSCVAIPETPDSNFELQSCRDCASASSCSDCGSLTGCGWCHTDNTCSTGTNAGPRESSCPYYSTLTCDFPEDSMRFSLPLLSEEFAGTTLSSDWVQYPEDSTSWTINDVLQRYEASETSYLTYSPGSWTDCSLSFTVYSEGRESFGAVLRYSNESSHYSFEWVDRYYPDSCSSSATALRTRRLSRVHGGTTDVLYEEDIGYINHLDYVIEVHVYETGSATQIDLWIQGEFIVGVIDSQANRPIQGTVGVTTAFTEVNVIEFDNITVKVTAPTTSPTTSPTSTPTSSAPSLSPSTSPSVYPSMSPTIFPSSIPTTTSPSTITESPTISPTVYPSSSVLETKSPTSTPSESPSIMVTTSPTFNMTVTDDDNAVESLQSLSVGIFMGLVMAVGFVGLILIIKSTRESGGRPRSSSARLRQWMNNTLDPATYIHHLGDGDEPTAL